MAGLLRLCLPSRRMGAFGALLAAAAPAWASFHFMQIEQVIGGVGGDPSIQAIQLRLRFAGQNQVSQARIRVWDANGANPVLVVNFTSNVAGGAAGSRILIATPGFAGATSPAAVPDFVMTNAIPESYLAAGRLTFESDTGTILWSLAWGGAGYTGSSTGAITNDVDGNFGPPFAGPLASTTTQAVRFLFAPSAPSVSNIADYELPAGAATFRNNAGAAFNVILPPCAADFDDDGFLTGLDFDGYVAAFEAGEASADFDDDGFITGLDFDSYVAAFEAGC